MWPFRGKQRARAKAAGDATLAGHCGGVVARAGPVEVLRCAEEHARDVVRLLSELARHEGYPPPAFTYESYRRELLGPEAWLEGFVARLEGRTVGYTLFHPAYDTQSGERGAYMVDLFVEAQCRGQGVGRALMAAAARRSAVWGGSFLWWSAKSRNHVAMSFYAGVGEQERDVATWACFGDRFQSLLRDAAKDPQP